MKYVKTALARIAMLCACLAWADDAMRPLGDLRRTDYVVTSLAGVTNDIAGLKTGLGGVSNEVSDLRVLVSALGGVTNDISSLMGFSSLSNEVAGLKTGLGGVSNEVEAVKGRLLSSESGLGAVSNSLSSLEAGVADLADYATNSWEATLSWLRYLDDYATNNYMAARLANYRALRLELWRQADTNSIAQMRERMDNVAHATTYGDWEVSAYTTDTTGWTLEFTPNSDDPVCGTWSLVSGTNVLGRTWATMSADAVSIAPTDWTACSVDPLPTAARPIIASDGTPFATYDVVLSAFWDRAPALPAGKTYMKRGKLQDAAVAIGPHARAALSKEAAATTSQSVLRSVSVAIGGYADAQATNGALSQAIAIGYCSKAKGQNAIAIGSGAQHFDESDMDSDAAIASGDESIAAGYGAKALGRNSVQIGHGVNSVDDSLQFFGVTVVKDGKLAVQADVRTNDVQNIIREALAPQTLTAPMQGEVVQAKSYTTTTLAPTSGVPDEVVISHTAARNYEIYIPNTPVTRRGLPMRFTIDPDYTNGVVRLGAWWSRCATRLPLVMRVRTPVDGTVLLDVETYDDGTDWAPVMTNAVWATDSTGALSLTAVRGYNLHNVAGVTVTYTNSSDEVVTATYTNCVPTYAVVSMAGDIAVPGLKDGTSPTVTVTPVGGMGYRTLNSVLDEKNAGWR